MTFKKAVLIEVTEKHLNPANWQKLDALVESRVSFSKDDPAITAALADADCLLVGYQITVSKEMIDAAPNLKYIGVLATAFGTIDVEYAAEKNIPVSNLGGYSTESVAEFTIAMILYQLRGIEQGRTNVLEGNYSTDGFKAREIKASEFGVIGLGAIGGRVAEIAAGFGANVSYWSRHEKDVSFTHKELNDLLSSSSIISVNVAQTADTNKLLNADNLALIQAGSVVVSTVPTEVIDTQALADRLAKGDITFISDHPASYPPEELALLKDLPNCVLIPGIAYLSDEAKLAMQQNFVDGIAAALAGNPINQVN